MGKSVYYEPLKILGEKEQPQIIVDAMAIYDLLVRAEMMMTGAASLPMRAIRTMRF